MDNKTTIQELKEVVQVFCGDRSWDQFHGAKDLAIGISTEANELLELFRFKSDEQIDEMFRGEKREMIEDELADTFVFILRFAQKYNINLSNALSTKLEKTMMKYPVSKSKGNNSKYTEL